MDRVRSLIRDVPDFPKPGILFKDITPVLADAEGLRLAQEGLQQLVAGHAFDKVAAIESRGFIFGAPLAHAFRAGFVPIRKPGKLPYKTKSIDYKLEYGQGHLEVHEDAFKAGDRVLVIDDVLATGGTAWATCQLIEQQGAVVVGLGFLIELSFLDGRQHLSGRNIQSLIRY